MVAEGETGAPDSIAKDSLSTAKRLGYFESLYRPAGSEAVSDLLPLDRLPPLPALGKGGNVRPLVRLTPANTIAAPQKSRTPVMVMVGLALGVMCLCAFALTLPPRTLTAPNATGSAAAPLAAVTGTETPALASTAEATAVVVVPPTDTPPPAATKTVVPTSTIDPSFTPPTPTPSSTIAPTATPTEAPVGKMPGLVPDKLVAELRVLGYTCGAPDLAMGVYSWWCDRKTETKTFIVEIWSRTLDTIDAVRGTVIHLDLVADDTLALTLLKYLAALPYTNAQPEKATAWVEQTLPTIKQNGDVRTAQYGGVAYELYGLPTGRSLVVGTFVEP